MTDFTLKEFPELDFITEANIADDDDFLFYDKSEDIVKRTSKAQRRTASLAPIDSVSSFASIDLTSMQDRQQFNLLSFRPGGSNDSGTLYWDASKARTLHNGESIFSPTVPAPADYDSASDIADYKAGVGESAPTALGCFVRPAEYDENTDYKRQIFTATGGQTDFTLTEFEYVIDQSPSTIRVFVNGVFQMEDQIEELSSSSFRVIAGTNTGDKVYASTIRDLTAETISSKNYADEAKGYRDTTLTYKNEAETARDVTLVYRDETATLLDEFDDLYLGPKDIAPATDNDGDPLLVGALYYQRVAPNQGMKEWDGSAWVASFATINISTDAWPIDTTQVGVLSVNTYWYVDTSAARSRDLPASPTNNDEIHFLDNLGSASTNNFTIGRNGNTIMGLAEDLVVKSSWARFTLKYNSGDWRIVK